MAESLRRFPGGGVPGSLLRGTIKPPAEPWSTERGSPGPERPVPGRGRGRHAPGETAQRGSTPCNPAFRGFDRFVFSNGPVKEGLVRRGAAFEEEEAEEEETVDARKGVKIPSQDLVLDRAGSARTALQKIPSFETPMEVLTEMEFKDPNGEIQTVSTRIPLWSSRYLIGIKPGLLGRL